MNVESFAAIWESLERLTIAEVLKTLREFGAFARPGISHDAKSLAASCGIIPDHIKLLGRWLDLLCKAGFLERDGFRFVNRACYPTRILTGRGVKRKPR